MCCFSSRLLAAALVFVATIVAVIISTAACDAPSREPDIREVTRRAAQTGAQAIRAKPTGLGAEGLAFTIDGQARFLIGVSLFDALGRTPPRDEDLDTLARWGLRIVRVWAHWSDPIYAHDGALSSDGRARLLRLVGELRRRGLVLELVLLRPGQLPGQRFAALASSTARLQAVREIALALRSERDILFDLYNEHDHPDGPIDHDGIRELRDAVKKVDPQRLVTVSSTEYHFLSPRGALTEEGRANLRAEVVACGIDVLAAHPPGTADWAQTTSARVGQLRAALEPFGRSVPIYLNENRRARSGDPPIAAEEYLAAAIGARKAGAAGWIFHTAAGYQLANRPFLVGLLGPERAALEKLARIVGSPPRSGAIE